MKITIALLKNSIKTIKCIISDYNSTFFWLYVPPLGNSDYQNPTSALAFDCPTTVKPISFNLVALMLFCEQIILNEGFIRAQSLFIKI